MPAWWGKKSNKNKEESQNRSPRGTSIGVIKLSPNKPDATAGFSGGGAAGKMKAAAAAAADDKNNNNYSKSFDGGGGLVLTTSNSPRASREFNVVVGCSGGGSSGFSGLESDSGEKIGIPLPTPSISSMQSDHVVGLGSGWHSVSSDSSSDDNQIANDPVQFLAYRFHFPLYVLDSKY